MNKLIMLGTGCGDVGNFYNKSEDKVEINGIEYTFFDINARGTKQFGFECIMGG